MPRPGLRPYECIRKAWHSERHQPIRGSIIQQIFRLVTETEAHSSATKNNREWKEKLPAVVLRAEEIMYSKAYSEAEYTNLETLWERVNDAIDTIIRREESRETGDLLPPCVEAALYLGCVPVKASRSQRRNNPRSYLTPTGQGPPSILLPNKNACCKYDPTKNVEIQSIPSSGSVYPLYYGDHHLGERSYVSPEVPENPSYNTVFVRTPVRTFSAETPRLSTLQSLMSHEKTTESVEDVEPGGSDGKARCDLSLRLSLRSEQCESTERTSGDAGSSYSQELCFFPSESY